MKSMTSREASQDFRRAKREAKSGPVIITERGRPANVLMSYDDYERLTEKPKSLFDRVAIPGQEEVDFEPPPRQKAAPCACAKRSTLQLRRPFRRDGLFKPSRS